MAKAAQATGIDSRRSPRRVFNRGVGVLCEGQYEVVQALQISEGGLAFVTASRLNVGDCLVVTMVIPGGNGLVLRGSVVNSRDPIGKMNSYGIEFKTLDLHQRRMIRSYVSAKTQAEAEREED